MSKKLNKKTHLSNRLWVFACQICYKVEHHCWTCFKDSFQQPKIMKKLKKLTVFV